MGVNARLRNRVASAQNLAPDSVADAAARPGCRSATMCCSTRATISTDRRSIGSVLRTIYASSTIVDDTVDGCPARFRTIGKMCTPLYGQYEFDLGPAGDRCRRSRRKYARDGMRPTRLTIRRRLRPSRRYPATRAIPTSSRARRRAMRFAPDLIGRLAVSSTIARPGFNQVTAATTIDPGGSISTGNPELKPITSTGIDLSIEKYLSQAGIASFGIFDKEIRDYIVTQESSICPGVHRGGFVGQARPVHLRQCFAITCCSAWKPIMCSTSAICCPGRSGGLGVSTNWTWVQSRYDIRPGETVGAAVHLAQHCECGAALRLESGQPDVWGPTTRAATYSVWAAPRRRISGRRSGCPWISAANIKITDAVQCVFQRQEPDEYGPEAHRRVGR